MYDGLRMLAHSVGRGRHDCKLDHTLQQKDGVSTVPDLQSRGSIAITLNVEELLPSRIGAA